MGGSGAPRSAEQGADSIVWPLLQDNVPSGCIFNDGQERTP